MLKKIFLIGLLTISFCLFCSCNNDKGELTTIEDAYKFGWITQSDLMEICYNRFGEVWIGENSDYSTWVKIQYTPSHSFDTIDIDKKTEKEIKRTYYRLNKNKFFDKEGNSIGGINDLYIECFGIHNNVYILKIHCSLWDTGTIVTPVLLAGVGWWEPEGDFCVYKKN